MTASLAPLELLYEAEGLSRRPLPEELAVTYGGELDVATPCVYANFVSSLDGVVAIPGLPGSNDFVAGDNDADRFVMGLLRAYADAVLIGAGVLAASPRGTWLPERIHPPSAAAYAALRRELGVEPEPEVAVVTGSGSVDPEHPLFATGAVVLTTDGGAERLSEQLPSATTVVALARDGPLAPERIVAALRDRGRQRILCEAGPHTFGALLDAAVVDELFLTTSPLLAGDAGTGSRLRLVEDADLVPRELRPRLLSLRRHGSHLFARYDLR